jgi:hydrogenase maturation protein HypF
MTSGNRSDEPIAASIVDAVERLDDIADLFLLHDREIVSPIDDSVVRLCAGRPAVIRRARGYAPMPIRLPHPTPAPILAVGGHLKSTFTIAVGRDAYVSPHLGDLDGLETLNHFRSTLERYSCLFRVTPAVVARDLHGGYLSTRIAAELDAAEEIIVQHHHAHIAAVLGEHARDGRVLGIAFDGTGQGDDGTVWGAEFLFATQAGYTRAAHLRSAPLAGGDVAVRSPWRTALGYLSLEPAMTPEFQRAFDGVDATHFAAAEKQIARRLNSPLASSMGRLFDAAAAVLGVCRVARYEGEAAMRLESLAGSIPGAVLPFPVAYGLSGLPQLDPLPLLGALGECVQRGGSVGALAAAFHESVAAGTATLAADLCAAADVSVVALGGGVFQNARLAASLRGRLEARRLTVLAPIDLPANDGGLSYGQAVVAAARLRAR